MLIVMPRGPKSRARPRAIPCSADLLSAYDAMPGTGMRSPFTEPITMIRPPGGILRAASTEAWYGDCTLMRNRRSTASGSCSRASPKIAMPAFTTSTSSGPLSRTRAMTASRSELSVCTAVLPVSAASAWAASGEPE